MSTSVSFTVSPSRTSLRRSTPWVLGCCGPMLMSIISVRNIPGLSAKLQVVPIVPLGGVFLSQRMSLPLVGEQNAPQVRVPFEGNPQKIEGLPLMPVGSAPDLGNAGCRLQIRDPNLQVDAMAMRDGEEVVTHLEALLPVGVVHPAQIGQVIHPEGRLVLQKPADLEQALFVQEYRHLAGVIRDRLDRLGKFSFERVENRRLHDRR